MRVVTCYLVDRGLTVGWSLPARRSKRAEVPAEANGAERGWPLLESMRLMQAWIPTFQRAHPPPRTDLNRLSAGTRVMLPNGLRILTDSRPGSGIVALDLFVDAGFLRESNPGGATSPAAPRGRHDVAVAEDVAETIEDIGVLEVASTGVSVRVRAEDLKLAIDLMADLILRPVFPRGSMDWIKNGFAARFNWTSKIHFIWRIFVFAH